MNGRKIAALVTLVLVLVALPVFARSASAAPVITNGRPLAPAIGYSQADGSFLAVWSEDRGTGTGMDIYGARVTRSGIVVGTERPIIVAQGNQSDPTLAFSDRNRAYLLIYTDDGSGSVAPPTTPGVPTPGGPPLPTPGGTSPPPPPPPPPAPILMSGDADAGLALQPASSIGLAPQDGPQALQAPQAGQALQAGRAGVHAVPISAGLVAVSPNQPAPTIPPPTAGPPPTGIPGLPTPGSGTPNATPPLPTPPGNPNVTPTPGGPPVPPTTPGSRDLWGTWLSPAGIRLTNLFAVVNSPADDTYPDLGYIHRPTSDQFALVWREVTGTDAQISVMRLEGLGYYFIPYAKAAVAAGGDLGRPSVAGEPNAGDYFVTWSLTPSDSPARDIYGRKLNSNAYPYGITRKVVTGAEDQTYPSIASLGAAGGYLLTYESRQMGQVPDIRTRRLNRNGVAMRIEYNLAGGPAFSFAPDIASSNSFSTLLVWLDRNAASDHSVIAAEVSNTGRRLGPERLVVQGGSGPGAVTPVVPPPPFPTPPVPPVPPLPTP
jgi:hypothetical protein